MPAFYNTQMRGRLREYPARDKAQSPSLENPT